MSSFQGDFLGFTIGGVHSSQLKIVRISSGDRYDYDLLPEFKDTTIEVPGGDGTFYQNTYYTKKTFTINFAFDDLGDYEIKRLSQILGFKGLKPLIFDEAPHKKYMVKSSQPPNLKYICFDGPNHVKIYKGEGTLNLVAYYPYATSETYFRYITTSNGVSNIEIINDGDLPTDNFKLIISLYNGTTWAGYTGNQIFLSSGEQLNIAPLVNKNNYVSRYLIIDMRTHLIEGAVYNDEDFISQYAVLPPKLTKTGELFNNLITGGDFFKIPVGKWYVNTTRPQNSTVSNSTDRFIQYNLIYY